MSWAHETSRVRLYATAHGTTDSVVPRGCHLEIFKCCSTARQVVVLLWLPPVRASLDSSAVLYYQDLRHVSSPLGKPTETRANLKIWNYGHGAANMELPCRVS